MEWIVPVYYVGDDKSNVASFIVLGYKIADKVHTKVLYENMHYASAGIVNVEDGGYSFGIGHVFIGRILDRVLHLPQDEVEVGRLYIALGSSPTSTPHPGTEMASLVIPEGTCTVSYEHISGPHIADIDMVVKKAMVQEKASDNLIEISFPLPKDLVPDRAIYLEDPQDILIPGIVNGEDEIDFEVRTIQDMLMKDKTKKQWIM